MIANSIVFGYNTSNNIKITLLLLLFLHSILNSIHLEWLLVLTYFIWSKNHHIIFQSLVYNTFDWPHSGTSEIMNKLSVKNVDGTVHFSVSISHNIDSNIYILHNSEEQHCSCWYTSGIRVGINQKPWNIIRGAHLCIYFSNYCRLLTLLCIIVIYS